MKIVLITIGGIFFGVAAAENSKSECDPEKYDRRSMGKCSKYRAEQVDKGLEVILRELNEGFRDKESSKTALDNAQKAWDEFIKLDCKFQKPNKGGREWGLVYNECLTKHKKERLRQLKAIPSCGNGCIH